MVTRLNSSDSIQLFSPSAGVDHRTTIILTSPGNTESSPVSVHPLSLPPSFLLALFLSLTCSISTLLMVLIPLRHSPSTLTAMCRHRGLIVTSCYIQRYRKWKWLTQLHYRWNLNSHKDRAHQSVCRNFWGVYTHVGACHANGLC